MAQQTNDTLKGFFENNDTITATTFGDLIDSYLSLVETSAQTVTSPITISAVTFVQASGTRVQAQETDVSALTVTGAFSADNGSLNFSNVSASAFNVKTSVSGSAAYFDSLYVGTRQIGGAKDYGMITHHNGRPYNNASGGQGYIYNDAIRMSALLVTSNFSAVNPHGPDLVASAAYSAIALKYKGATPKLFYVVSNGEFDVTTNGGSALADEMQCILAKMSSSYDYFNIRLLDSTRVGYRGLSENADECPYRFSAVVSADASSVWTVCTIGAAAGTYAVKFNLTMVEI